jgi:hypothetical protein
MASVMGPGVMLIVLGAVLRVLFARSLAFERTPKYGIAHASDSWDRKRYALGADGALVLELLLACFGMATVTYAGALHMWGSFLYSAYFLSGLLFIVAWTIGQLTAPALPRALAAVGGRDL